MRHRVVLVRGPRAAGGHGGGCCTGDVHPFDAGGSRSHRPPPDEVGDVYRALRAALPPDVGVEVVSPSNWLWLLPTLVRDGRGRGLRGRSLRRSVGAGLAAPALVVDGVVLSSGRLPDPTTAVTDVRTELALG